MHYLVDGHNLIGHIPAIDLHDPDDEAKLVALLHRFVLRHPRHTMTVVFDGGTYGHPGSLARERVSTIFARRPEDADARLIGLLHTVKRPAEYRLVTSDRAIVAVARQAGVAVVSAQQFAAELQALGQSPAKPLHRKPRPEPRLPSAEVEAWLRMFDER